LAATGKAFVRTPADDEKVSLQKFTLPEDEVSGIGRVHVNRSATPSLAHELSDLI
jgi:hypothetical protein